ncbi:hypothetical protein GVN24_29255 [Rhizobium sp. CRIBSB]|nr:hypothetical protein [Rhizobium sp. CRIBSB]
MSDVVNLIAYRKRKKLGRAHQVDQVMAEIVDALAMLGGAAHRRAIADQVYTNRTGSIRSTPKEIECEVYQALDIYGSGTADRPSPPLVERPLGEGSYRWALTGVGRTSLPARPAHLQRV